MTLTATVSAADGSSPAGTVQFETGSTDIGSPVTVINGVATTTATFATAGSAALSATFTPSSSSYGSSTGTDNETVSAYGGSVPVAFTVPQSGSFTLTVTPGTVPWLRLARAWAPPRARSPWPRQAAASGRTS